MACYTLVYVRLFGCRVLIRAGRINLTIVERVMASENIEVVLLSCGPA